MKNIRIEDFSMPAVDIGQLNPLPDLKTVQYIHAGVTLGPGVTPEDAKYIGYGKVSTILPYMIQDGYTRSLETRVYRAAVLENEHLRATFLPELGGRLWSLYNKDKHRELLYVNPVFQPCNLALRNAWFSGGVEWNIGIKGHNPYTCDPLHAEIVEHDGMTILRMYEFERIRRAVYQIEAWLPEGSQALYVKVRIKNASDSEVPMYWWSNIAVPETSQTRVLVPADEAFQCLYGSGSYMIDRVNTPNGEGTDYSYPTRLQRSMDFFFIVPKKHRKWIVAVDGNGIGLFETSTMNLLGRKVFQWGMSAGGQHWQEFLSVPGKPYIEIQAGLARTQLEHIPMHQDESWEFLEAFGMADLNPDLAFGEEWGTARNEAESGLDRMLGGVNPEDMLRRWGKISEVPGKAFIYGSGWGALENMRRTLSGKPALSSALVFPQESIGREQTDWLCLLKNGTLPEHSPNIEPVSFMTQPEWLKLLEASLALNGGRHWYSLMMLGVMCYADGDIKGARQAWEDSLSEQPTGWSFRNLAKLDLEEGNIDSAVENIDKAYRLLPENRHVAQEYAKIMIEAGKSAEFLHELRKMPQMVSKHPRIQFFRAQALCNLGLAGQARRILEDGFVLPDIREGEISLAGLWEEINRAEAQCEQKGHMPPLPYHLNFQMD